MLGLWILLKSHTHGRDLIQKVIDHLLECEFASFYSKLSIRFASLNGLTKPCMCNLFHHKLFLLGFFLFPYRNRLVNAMFDIVAHPVMILEFL